MQHPPWLVSFEFVQPLPWEGHHWPWNHTFSGTLETKEMANPILSALPTRPILPKKNNVQMNVPINIEQKHFYLPVNVVSFIIRQCDVDHYLQEQRWRCYEMGWKNQLNKLLKGKLRISIPLAATSVQMRNLTCFCLKASRLSRRSCGFRSECRHTHEKFFLSMIHDVVK